MKKVGIVADNYKVNKFKKELSKKGFNDIEVFSFTEESSTIQINVPDEEFHADKNKIAALCYNVEAHFKRSN